MGTVGAGRTLPRRAGLSSGKEEHPVINEGTLDRTIRVIVGLALVSLTLVGPRSPWGLVGLVPLATGVVGFCPLYRLVGLSTRRVPARSAGGGTA